MLEKQLGFGAFGSVFQATARGISGSKKDMTVAVKIARRDAEAIQMQALVDELKIMTYLGKHLNVIDILGACTKTITKG